MTTEEMLARCRVDELLLEASTRGRLAEWRRIERLEKAAARPEEVRPLLARLRRSRVSG